jgi:hypothetical protein
MIEKLSNDNTGSQSSNNTEAKPLTFVRMTVADVNAPAQVRMRDVGDLGIAQGD